MNPNIPAPISELLADLIYVSKLPSGNKLNIHYKHYSNYSIIESLKRSFWGENRRNTITWLNKLLDRSITLSNTYPNWRHFIINHVIELKNAVDNLKSSYHDDPDIISQLSVFNIRIDEIISAFNNNIHIMSNDVSKNISNNITPNIISNQTLNQNINSLPSPSLIQNPTSIQSPISVQSPKLNNQNIQSSKLPYAVVNSSPININNSNTSDGYDKYSKSDNYDKYSTPHSFKVDINDENDDEENV